MVEKKNVIHDFRGNNVNHRITEKVYIYISLWHFSLVVDVFLWHNKFRAISGGMEPGISGNGGRIKLYEKLIFTIVFDSFW